MDYLMNNEMNDQLFLLENRLLTERVQLHNCCNSICVVVVIRHSERSNDFAHFGCEFRRVGYRQKIFSARISFDGNLKMTFSNSSENLIGYIRIDPCHTLSNIRSYCKNAFGIPTCETEQLSIDQSGQRNLCCFYPNSLYGQNFRTHANTSQLVLMQFQTNTIRAQYLRKA